MVSCEFYSPNEKVVDRAIELWKGVLRTPKFNNGDTSSTGVLTHTLALLSWEPPDEKKLLEFGKRLKELLLNPICADKFGFRYHNYLGVDYEPEPPLLDAARAVGLDTWRRFPWKTSMFLYSDCLAFAVGYRSELVYHYLLPDGRWLVTTLHGSDIEKVKEYVLGGKPEFLIEEG